MYRIAICEDNLKMGGSIEQALIDYAQSIPLKISTEVFGNAEELYEDLVNGSKYDFIFLDIELKELNGIQLGVLIRNVLKNQIVRIAYISIHTELIEEIFEAEPQYFIAKPTHKEKVISVFQDMINKHQSNVQDFFVYKYYGETYRVALKNIIYFRVSNRTVYIKTISGEDSFYGKIKDIWNSVKDNNFFVANRNHLINFNYIASFTAREVHLQTDEIIPLSRRNYKELLMILNKDVLSSNNKKEKEKNE